jgi:acetyl-CoA carboxylase biotin carboxyl carrier protein
LTCRKADAYDARELHPKENPALELKEIKELIALMKKNDLSVFKMEREGFRIVLKKGGEMQYIQAPAVQAPPVLMPATPGGQAAAGGTTPEGAAAEGLKEITSPMVGTFYRSASPESPPYCDVGSDVTEDSVVCIIEAMKVMNEIKAEVRGRVVEVLVENGKPVQFGQPLFRIK